MKDSTQGGVRKRTARTTLTIIVPLLFIRRKTKLLAKAPQFRTNLLRSRTNHGGRICITKYGGNPSTKDSSLLKRNLLTRVAEVLHVIQPDAHQQRCTGIKGIHRIQTAAEADLKNRNIDFAFHKQPDRRQRTEFEIGQCHAGSDTRPLDCRKRTDQIGIIRIVDHARLLSEAFLDLRPWLNELTPAYDERGLLGLAFHPQFDRKDHPGFRKFYTFTSEPPGPSEVPLANAADRVDHLNVVTEWRVSDNDTNHVDIGSRRVVFSYATPNFHHNGGCLAFGHDGLLYISVGDGGTGAVFTPGKPPVGVAQDIESPRGKILRIDPLGLQGVKAGTGQYSCPSDNPYIGRPGLDAIYALGLRNPWRMSFDRATGELIVGDVGQSVTEEVNIVKRGGNYGWPIKEGDSYFSGGLGKLTRDMPWAGQLPLVDPVLA